VVGEMAERHPELVRRMAAEGHAVGNHTFNHAAPESTPAQQLMAEVERTDRLLSGLTGGRSFPFRPRRADGCQTVAAVGAGRSVVLWNVDPKDYASDSTVAVRDWFGRRPLRAGTSSSCTTGCLTRPACCRNWSRRPRAGPFLPDRLGVAAMTELSCSVPATARRKSQPESAQARPVRLLHLPAGWRRGATNNEVRQVAPSWVANFSLTCRQSSVPAFDRSLEGRHPPRPSSEAKTLSRVTR
jgi:hypothetical protein